MREGDFERLYEEHAQGLFGFLIYRTGDRVLAEDLLADTFERVLRTRIRFDPRRASRKTWLYTIALNLLRDHSRRRSVEERALERAATPLAVSAESGGYDAVDDREALRSAMAVLTAEEHDAIALRFGGDLTVPEIARLTGQPLTTVEGRVSRALRKLRSELC
jgi:RNA polymerase sigma-70 factor (ECF subfamily)